MKIGSKFAAAVIASAMLLGACSGWTAAFEKKNPAEASSSQKQPSGVITGVSSSRPAVSQTEKVKASSSSDPQVAKPQVTLSTETPVTGDAMAIYVENADNISAVTSLGFVPRFFEQGNRQIALLPISYTTTPGDYTLTVTADGKPFYFNITVTDRDFEEQYLTVDETVTKNTAGNAEANNQWTRLIEPLKLISDPQQYWDGPFISPISGEIKDKISTEYGSIRYTNGSQVASRHSGIDIAVKAGTPVLAAGNGRVQFAGYLTLTGNTVVIEHGYGLKSLYYHMESLNVEEGDMVKQGQQIGAVGSTGFSTGPHCHFSMAVNNVFTNPWFMIEQGIG